MKKYRHKLIHAVAVIYIKAKNLEKFMNGSFRRQFHVHTIFVGFYILLYVSHSYNNTWNQCLSRTNTINISKQNSHENKSLQSI